MGKFCEICGKGVVYGNNVSHSNRKTRRTAAHVRVHPLPAQQEG